MDVMALSSRSDPTRTRPHPKAPRGWLGAKARAVRSDAAAASPARINVDAAIADAAAKPRPAPAHLLTGGKPRAKCSVPGGRVSQECTAASSHTEKLGAGNPGSANEPTVIP